MRRQILPILLLFVTVLLAAQSPESFNYQAVVRTSDGSLADNQDVSLRFSILEGTATGVSIYVETHQVQTNQYGLVNLQIGQGTVVSGAMSSVDWGSDKFFLKVDLDINGGSAFTDMSTQQLVAVPYALHAQTVENSDNDETNELQTLSVSGSNLTLSDGGGTVSVADDDSDPANELQAISRSGNDLTLSDGGGTVSLADNDNDAANELQSISLSGTNLTLSSGGGTISIADNDNDASNEIQSLSKSGSTVTLSSGGNISLNDDDASNELQTISRSGDNLTLSDGGGTVSIADNDDDDSNEFQDLTSAGDSFSLTNSSVHLSLNALEHWQKTGSDLYYNTGSVGINESTPAYALDVNGEAGFSRYLRHKGDNNTYVDFDTDKFSLFVGGEKMIESVEASDDYLMLGDGGDININLNENVWVDGGTQTVGIGTQTPNNNWMIDVYSPPGRASVIKSYNNIDSSGGLILSNDFFSGRSSSANGSMIGINNYVVHNPESGNGSIMGGRNLVYAGPDDASNHYAYGQYNYVGRSDSGSGNSIATYSRVLHSGTDGLAIGNYTDVDVTGDNADLGVGQFVAVNRTYSGSSYGVESNVYHTNSNHESGSAYGYKSQVYAYPSSGSGETAGLDQVVQSRPGAGSGQRTYGIKQEINRQDSGYNHTYGYYLDLNHNGNDGYTYGYLSDIDITGEISDGSTGIYTSLTNSSSTNSTMYGFRNFVVRSSGNFGQTCGNYTYVALSNLTSGAFPVYGNITSVLLDPPYGNTEVFGDYISVSRGGGAYGESFGSLVEVTHDSNGGLFGQRLNINRTSQSSTYQNFGTYADVAANGGTSYGFYADLNIGTNSTSTIGTSYGGYFTSERRGTGNHHSYGFLGRSLNYATGTGARYSIGTYGYSYIGSSNGTSYSYGIYGSASGLGDYEYAGYFSGSVYTTGSYLPSDLALKRDVVASESSLDRIMDLQVYNYKYNNEKYSHMNLPSGKQTGFIAQEMQELFPELTTGGHQPPLSEEEIERLEEDGVTVPEAARNGVDFTAVNYAGLVPHLTMAIQEQQEEISTLENQLETLLLRIENLEQQIEKGERP